MDEEQEKLDKIYAAQEAHWCEKQEREQRPSTRLKPKLSMDGAMWRALHGENLQEGVAGFGHSPEEAYADFDRAWTFNKEDPTTWSRDTMLRVCKNAQENQPGSFMLHLTEAIRQSDSVNMKKVAELFGDKLVKYYID